MRLRNYAVLWLARQPRHTPCLEMGPQGTSCCLPQVGPLRVRVTCQWERTTPRVFPEPTRYQSRSARCSADRSWSWLAWFTAGRQAGVRHRCRLSASHCLAPLRSRTQHAAPSRPGLGSRSRVYNPDKGRVTATRASSLGTLHRRKTRKVGPVHYGYAHLVNRRRGLECRASLQRQIRRRC